MIETNDSVMSTRDYVKQVLPYASSEEIRKVQLEVENKLSKRKKKYLFHTEVDKIITNRISNGFPNPIPVPVPDGKRKFTRNKNLVVVKNGKEMPLSEAVKHFGDAKDAVLSRVYNYRHKHQIRDRILSNVEESIISGFKSPTDVEDQTSDREDFSAEHVPPVNAENIFRRQGARYEEIVEGLKKGLEVMQSKSERKDFSAEHVPPVNAEIPVPINQLYLNFMNSIVNKEVHHKHFPSFSGKITSANESGITVEWKEQTAKSNFEWSESGFLIILQ